MKAPDKIYLSVGKGEDWAYAMWTQKSSEEQKFSELDEHEEYIRKDLYDKLKEKYEAFKSYTEHLLSYQNKTDVTES